MTTDGAPPELASNVLDQRYQDPRARRHLTWLLAGLSMLGPFSIDTYLPAFPLMEAALPATEVQMQLTMTVYFIGFAIATLFHGAISDSIGRKPVIFWTVLVHAAGSVGCALSTSIDALLFFRALQGCFAGAGFVVGRAVVRDLFAGDEAQRQLSRIQMLFALAPIIAPILGGWLVAHLGWPSIFWFLASYALILAGATRFSFVESHQPEHRLLLAVGPLVRVYRDIFFNKTFQLLAAIPAFIFTGFFVYIAGAPAFLMRELGLGTTEFATLFIPTIVGITTAAFLSGKLAGRISHRAQMSIGFAIMLVTALVNLAVSLWLPPRVIWNIAPVAIYAFGMALVTPIVTLKLLDEFAHARGSVSALQSSAHVAMMAVCTALIVPFAQRSLVGFATAMLGAVAVASVVYFLYEYHHPEAAHEIM